VSSLPISWQAVPASCQYKRAAVVPFNYAPISVTDILSIA